MDEAKVREHAERHGKSVERGDMAAVASDLVEELHPQIPAIGQILPNPCTKAEVLSVEPDDDHAIVHIRYSGDDKTVTIRSRWEERGGTPMIVDAGPVE
ncbi:MAG TPA: hypothetical protein VJU60_00310 [Thermoleophilaceae bacterium]|nr:hypothetical protein [Thermoleophilaceae bacterium]